MSRLYVSSSLAIALVLASSVVRADDDETRAVAPAPRPAPPPYDGSDGPVAEPGARSAPPPYVPEPAPTAPPLGHRGFQLALRTGVAIPMGSVKDFDIQDKTLPGGDSTSLSDLVSLQVPITVDIGGKPNKHIFIGGYLGFGFGRTKGELARGCGDLHRDCSSTSVNLGAQIHYDILPNDWVNPWIGYGLGYSWLTAGDNGYDTSLRGFDFAHFLAGVDFRLSRAIGIGLFVDFSMGSYSRREIDTPTIGRVNGDIDHRTIHEWFMIGPRAVFLP